MKIKDVLYKTPELSEERLLEIIKDNIPMMKDSSKKIIQDLHPNVSLAQAFLDEYDIIQCKQSTLSRSQRDQIVGFVGLCMIKMTKDGGESSSTN